MEETNTSLLLKRPVTLKVIVTPRWKEEVQQQLQAQLEQLDTQLQQLDMQGQQAIAEIQKRSITPPPPQVAQQIESVKAQVNQKKAEMLERKTQFLQQQQQVQGLELEEEVAQAQLESFFRIEKGDNLVKKMAVEIVMRDGIVEDIRGEI
jgi:hypothetical protein